MTSSACPSVETLRQLIDDDTLDSFDNAWVHVRTCATCQARLDELSDDRELRDWGSHDSDYASAVRCEPGLAKVLGHWSQPSALVPSGILASERAAYDISFLGPAIRPGDLGSLGPYWIEAEVGRGGMGIVFRGYDPSLGRTVAVKVLRPSLADEAARARFAREAQAAARVKHDHLAVVHVVVNTPDALPYLVMEFVEGRTLAQRLRCAERLEPREAAEIVAQAADGLAAFHAAGLVHRDIKPSNILLETATGRAKLADFGLARVVAEPSGLTRTGFLAGTPTYMSPEEARGEANPGPAADIYSLGVTLYEALTRELPFRGASHLVLRQIQEDEPGPPRKLNDAVPRDLETICLKAMAKEPSRRYATAGELAGDLRRWQRGEPILARPVGALERGWRWCLRRPVVAALGAALVSTLAIGFGAVLWQWRRAETALAQSQRDQDRAERALTQSRRDQVRAEKHLSQARQAVDQFFTAVSEEQLAVEPKMERLRKRLLEQAVSYYRDFVRDNADDPRLRQELAETWHRVAMITRDIGTTDDAAKAFEQELVLRRASASEAPDDVAAQRDLAIALSYLADRRHFDGQFDAALVLLREARVVWERLTRTHPDDVKLQSNLGNSDNHLGSVLREAGQVDEAVASYERSLALWERLVREYPENVNFRDNLARLDYNFGELLLERDAARARDRFEQAVEIFAVFLDPYGLDGEVPINFALSLNGQAQAEIALERLAEARQSLERARERLESLFAEHASRVDVQQGLAANHNLSGELDLRSGNAEGALSEFHRAGGLLEPLVAADPRAHRYRSQWATVLRNGSQAQRKLHRIDEADANLRRAIDELDVIVEQAPDVANYRELLATYRAELDGE